MHRVRLVSVFVEDKLGALAKTTRALSDAGVSIRWVTIASGERFGVIKLLVDRTETAQAALAEHGYTVSLNEVLAVEVDDKPGGLAHVADALARHKLNVVNASGFVIASGRRAVLLIEVDDPEKAQAALKAQHVHLITEAELVKL
jgi:hypothetical protein